MGRWHGTWRLAPGTWHLSHIQDMGHWICMCYFFGMRWHIILLCKSGGWLVGLQLPRTREILSLSRLCSVERRALTNVREIPADKSQEVTCLVREQRRSSAEETKNSLVMQGKCETAASKTLITNMRSPHATSASQPTISHPMQARFQTHGHSDGNSWIIYGRMDALPNDSKVADY